MVGGCLDHRREPAPLISQFDCETMKTGPDVLLQPHGLQQMKGAEQLRDEQLVRLGWKRC